MSMLCRAVECVEDGIVITARASGGRPPWVVFTNPAFHAIANCVSQCGQTDGIPASAVEHDFRDDDPVWKSLIESHQHDGVFSTEIVRRDKDGSPSLLHLRSMPIQDESGQVTHRIAIFHDRTEVSNLEEAIRRNERLACIGLLAAGIAHEVNNPIGSALLAAETALAINESAGDGEPLAACLRNIATSLDRCGRIVKTLLRYTRHESSEKQACNINDVVEQALELARPYGTAHGADMRLNLDPQAPLTPMNPLEIELVLVNLIRNAIEAGGPSLTVAVDTMPTDSGVRVVVRDSGRGMNKEQLAHAFDPLYTTKKNRGGSGIGMSIAYGIVQGHEGRMEVRSEEGKGTTVTIDLPVAARPQNESDGKQGQHGYGANSNSRGRSVFCGSTGMHVEAGGT
jgi:signal transduction histidine kinase